MAQMKKLTYGGALFLLLALAWGQEGAPNDALLSGVKDLNAGNYVAAVADFREAASAQGADPNVHIWLGKALYATGAADEALGEWAMALRLDPANVVAKQCLSDAKLIDFARSLYEGGLYKECVDRLLREVGGERELMHDIDYLLAVCYFELGDVSQAQSYAFSALHRHPVGDKRDNAEVLLGRLEARQKKYEEAVAIYEKVIATYPGADGAIEAELRIADVWWAKGENDEAVSRYGEFIKQHPGHPLLWSAMLSQAECYKRMGEKEYRRNVETSQKAANETLNEPFRQAVSVYLSVIDGAPSRGAISGASAAVFSISDLYRSDQHWGAAHNVYQMCLEGERKGKDEFRFRNGILYEEEGLFEIQRLRGMNRKPPEDVLEGFRKAAYEFVGLVQEYATEGWAGRVREAVAAMAKPYKAERMWDTASKVFEMCLAPHPAEAGAYLLQDDMQYEMALVNFDEAADILAKQMQGQPKVEGLEMSGEFTRAIKALQGFVAANPKSELVDEARMKVIQVAEVYAGYQAWPVAIQALENFLKNNPDYIHPEDIYLRIGICHMAKVIKEIAKDEIALRKEVPPLGATARALEGPPGPQGPATPSERGEGYGAARIADLDVRTQAVEAQRSVQAAMEAQPQAQGGAPAPAPSEAIKAEKKERTEAFEQARATLQKVMDDYPQTAAAAQARTQIIRMIDYFKRENLWEEAAAMYDRFLNDNPKDEEIAPLTHQIALCLRNLAKAEAVAEDDPKPVLEAFERARGAYRSFIQKFPKSDLVDDAELSIALTHHEQGDRLAAKFPALAAGQYLLACQQLEEFDKKFPHSGQARQVPSRIYQLGQSLEAISGWEDSALCYQALIGRYPTDSSAGNAAERIAQIENDKLDSPLKATNSYLQLLWQYRPGDVGRIGDVVYGIGNNLQSKRRWVEATAVYDVFVNSFPKHPNADSALKAVGDIYKGNQIWDEAIAAYKKAIEDYSGSDVVAPAKLGMAECLENLSKWKEAIAAYEEFLDMSRSEGEKAQAQAKISILKDIVLYQQLIDEKVKTARLDDAQFQIATIVLEKLQNRVKAIQEFEKVVTNYTGSYLADDAQLKIGICYKDLDNFPAARENFEKLVRAYPDSPLADDALYWIGFTYEEEAKRLERETKEEVAGRSYDVAQAYNLQVAAQARAGRKAALGKEIVNEAPASAVGALVRSQSEEIAESGKLGEAAREQAAQMTAVELANRQDRINADLRLAVVAYDRVVKNYPLGDFADDSLLRMADIYYVNLKDTPKAMATYELLVQHYPGTAVSEEAAGKLGPYYEKEAKWREAIKAYQQYIYNFPQGKLVQDACFAIAGCQEQLEDWVAAMDAYQAFIDKFPNVPASQKAKDRISWIKTYRLGRD